MESDASSFAKRLRDAIGESVNAFAKRCEIPEATMRGYVNGKFPPSDVALKIADTANVNLEWLISGRGPQGKAPTEPSISGRSIDIRGRIMDDFAFIQRLDVQASAGSGAITINEDAVELLAFQSDWLKSRHINPTSARVLTAKGDSMEPTIRDGDILLVDTSITSVRDNAIYIVVYGGHVLVKRVNLRRNGSLVLISDNDRHAPEEVPESEVLDLHIAGRVMWFGRSI
ncbi:helix-turn-helix transcriptional regulator (plasmid) [Rhizobium lusitanum]|uniref:LexA family transcriptional regulator n=1 Tax=Rhizobium lusitanum TaxID=293958 RepID=UPI00161C2B77|nr:helix-turn-helix transcriptional regulator [Rhizobium lusitanum]QND45240.1 helix-turn-helix transcriptional regulator [Rhizobium lusitanum]